MVVIARTDPHATYDDVKEAHPDWIAVTADGKPRRHWASPELWVTCGLGPYNFEHMTEVHKEIMSLYRVDGIFINRWDGSGMCYCEHCQKHFKLATGLDLPRTNNPSDPARRQHIHLFGVSTKGRVEGPMQNSYLRLENDSATGKRHPVLAGLEDAPRIINGVWRVEVEPVERFYSTPLTLIPSYPDLPMEKVYPRVVKTDKTQVFLRELGRGRIVYFPWDIDRTFWEVLCLDHGRLLRNAIEWATNEERQVVVTGPGVLDVTAWLQKDSMTIHLVNLTNPMMMKGPFRELFPLGEQRVRIRLPQGKRPKKAQLLVRGKPAAFVEGVSSLDLVVPSILDHEVVAIDFL